MEDVGVFAFGARGGDFSADATGVAEEGEFVGVESERQEASGAEGLPTTVVAEGEWGGTAAVVEEHGHGAVFERVFDRVEEVVTQEAVFFEVSFVF